MSLFITIDTASELRQQFINYDRDKYSHEAYEALVEYYADSNEELDVIGICCTWNEEDLDTIISEYSIDLENITDKYGGIDDTDKNNVAMDYLNYRTYAIDCSGSILYQCF